MSRLQTGAVKKWRFCQGIYLPGEIPLRSTARIHDSNQGILWTSEHGIAPQCSHASIVLSIEGITCQIVKSWSYFITNNRSIRCSRVIRLEAHLPISSIRAHKRKTQPLGPRVL